MKYLKFMAVAVIAMVTSGVAAANDTGKVILGTQLGVQTAHIVVAIDRGLFEREGLDVEVVRYTSGRRALEALLGGQIDLGFMAEYPPAIASLQDHEFGIVTAISKFVGNRVITRADVDFSGIEDLAGKRIGTTVGSNNEYFTQLLLEKAGVEAEVVNIAPADIVIALERGDIDVAIPFPDYYGRAREVLGDDYRELISADYQSYAVISATRALIDDRPGDLEKFLKALVAADTVIRTEPEQVKEAIVRVSEGAFDPESVEQLWAEHTYFLGFEQQLLDTIVSEAQWVADKGIIRDAEADAEKIRAYFIEDPIYGVAPQAERLSD